jgi:putative flippase GtrA
VKELIRFFFVSAGGVVVDIAIAYAIATMLGTPLWIAAAVGFSVAACGNYILHEVWTFRRETLRLSSKLALYYFITSSVTLLSRLVVVAGLSAWISRDHAILILVGGAAVSFFVNYIISKYLIFSRRAEIKGHS